MLLRDHWIWTLWYGIIIIIVAAVVIFLIIQMLRKRYIYVRVVKSNKQPLPNIKVYGIRPRFKGRKLLGKTDENGEFRLCVGFFDVALIMLEGKNINNTHVPLDMVSNSTAFTEQPAVYTIPDWG